MIINNFNLLLSENVNVRTTGKNTGNEKTDSQIKKADSDSVDLSVSAKMTAQLQGLKESVNNINKAISFIKVADSYSNELHKIMLSLRKLSIKSANGTYSKTDRQLFQVEVSALVDEVDRIASQAEYNRFKLLTGEFSRRGPKASMWIHIGPNMNNRERIYIQTMTAAAFKFKEANRVSLIVSTPEGANRSIGMIDEALHKVSKQRSDFRGSMSRLKSAARSSISVMEKLLQHEDVKVNKNEIKVFIKDVKSKMNIH